VFPDEKGIETDKAVAAKYVNNPVGKCSPMRRGLRRIAAVVQSVVDPLVGKCSPMRRGLRHNLPSSAATG